MFAQRLKELRKANNITQVQLAEMLGVSKGSVAMWETGKRMPSFDVLDRMTDVFKRRIDYILGYSNDATEPHEPTEEEIADAGMSEVETGMIDFMRQYARLDGFGQDAVNAIIRAEYERCSATKTLDSASEIDIRIRFKREHKLEETDETEKSESAEKMAEEHTQEHLSGASDE